MEFDYVALILRWFHILAGIVLLGGIIFMRFGLLPAAKVLSEEQRTTFRESVRGAWAKWVHASVAFLFISGLINYGLKEMTYKLDMGYRGIWTVKFVLALALFGIASIYVGRSNRAQQMRENPGLWLNAMVGIGVLIVALSGVLRYYNVPLKVKATENPAALAPMDPAFADPAGGSDGDVARR